MDHADGRAMHDYTPTRPSPCRFALRAPLLAAARPRLAGVFVFHALGLAALPAEHLIILVLDILEGRLVSLLVDGDHDEVRKEDEVDARLGQHRPAPDHQPWPLAP